MSPRESDRQWLSDDGVVFPAVAATVPVSSTFHRHPAAAASVERHAGKRYLHQCASALALLS